MKKVLRLTGTRKLLKNESNFKASAQKLGGIDIDFLCYLDLFFDRDGKFKNIHTEQELGDYDFFWIGGMKALPFQKSFIYYYIHLLKKQLIDKRVASLLDNSKLSQIVLLKHLKIKIPESMFFILEQEYLQKYKKLILERFTYPFILKNPTLDRGEGVFLVKNEEDLEKYLRNSPDFSCYLVQEFIENDGDYRVLATKEKILGVIKRYNEKDFRNNISAGGESQYIETVPPKIVEITQQILEQYGLDIAGIDFFIKGDDYYVIEINDLPQYAGFEKSTGLSYSEEVLKYIKTLN